MSLFFDVQIAHSFAGEFSLNVKLASEHKAIGIIGPSGCGKTSLIHAMAGTLKVDQARVRMGGRTLDGQPPWERGVGLVAQDAMLFPLLNVRENICFGAGRGDGTVSVEQVVDLLEIGHLLARRVRNLSGGERQRVALGRALVSSPDVLLLDEPFAALDPPRRARLAERLAVIRETWSLPMVLVSHHSDDIGALVDEVFAINDGRVQRPVA